MRWCARGWGRVWCLGVPIVALVVGLATVGCTKKPKKDAFIEHWDAQTLRSEGYSPTARPRKVEFQKVAIGAKKDDKAEAKPTKTLPKQKVTLRMYDTDLVAVVRAMARAANQNVVLSSTIPGSAGNGQDKPLRINVNVADAPWDETFQSILSSNGLAYAFEGDIIKVMTLADLEQQNKLKEANNKLLAEKTKAKELEPYVTARVEINYAELPRMYATLSAMCGSATSNAFQGQNKQQTPQPSSAGQTPRDITPTSATDDTLKIQPQTGARQPGQLNCSVVPDQHSNSIIIQGPPADAEKLVALIEELDKPRPQVKLKAFIVQTDRETAQQLGLQWGGLLKNSNFRLSPAQAGTVTSSATSGNTASNNATSGTSGTTTSSSTSASNTNNSATTASNAMTPIFGGGTSGQGFGINNPANLTSTATGLGASGTGLNFLFGKIGENVLEAQLTALAEDSKIKILSSPTITTMENQTAFVENGKDIPYSSTSQNGTNVQFAHATLKLEMLPHVVDGTNLRMKIVVKDDQVDPNQTNWVDGNPPIYKRETQSNLVVEDGDTIVISGLSRNTTTDGESGVPFLRDVPGLGWAFKSKSSDVHREEMLIFVTPIILKEKPIPAVPPVEGQHGDPVAAATAARP